MRVAVVTPYHLEDIDTLARCYMSVRDQAHSDLKHVFVADGFPNPSVATLPGVEHMSLPLSHRDAGATPRAIGAISAFSRGYDAVAFLDADNTYQPHHIRSMVQTMMGHGVGVVTATRNICTSHGEFMYVDTIESTGDDFCDTNCLFIGRQCLNALTYWVTEPEQRLWSDRQFWFAIRQIGISRHHHQIPTVNYHSRWAWHYQHAGKIPPDDSVWIDRKEDGSLVHAVHGQLHQ